MAKIQTASNGRRFVDIDGVIERRLAQLKKASINGKSNGNGNGRTSQPKEGSSEPGPVAAKEEGRRATPVR
jgi:hypothetical protein